MYNVVSHLFWIHVLNPSITAHDTVLRRLSSHVRRGIARHASPRASHEQWFPYVDGGAILVAFGTWIAAAVPSRCTLISKQIHAVTRVRFSLKCVWYSQLKTVSWTLLKINYNSVIVLVLSDICMNASEKSELGNVRLVKPPVHVRWRLNSKCMTSVGHQCIILQQDQEWCGSFTVELEGRMHIHLHSADHLPQAIQHWQWSEESKAWCKPT